MNPRTKHSILSAEEIEERLDEHADAVLSARRTAAEPARRLAKLNAEQLDFVLHWVAAIAQTNAEIAYQFTAHADKALTHMDCEGVEAWVIQAMDAYDKKGLSAGIGGILPQDYTRMGVAIRHLSKLLNEVQARTKLLLTLSGGKPDDYTGYRGEYGIEDTRQSLFQARRDGIHPFCITIDDQAGDYLPHMYGAVNYVVIDDVIKLPIKVSEIYRRLTT